MLQVTKIRKVIESVFILCAILLSFTFPVYAQDEDRKFGAESGRLVYKAQKLVQRDKFDKAISKLDEALKVPNLSPYELSTIHSILGICYYEKSDLENSITHFQLAINENGMTPQYVQSTSKNIAQLYVQKGEYAEGARRLMDYNKTYGEDPKMTEYAMMAYMQAEDYGAAMPLAERWVDGADPKLRRHYDVLNVIYHELGLRQKQIDNLDTMITHWPDDKRLQAAKIGILTKTGNTSSTGSE